MKTKQNKKKTLVLDKCHYLLGKEIGEDITENTHNWKLSCQNKKENIILKTWGKNIPKNYFTLNKKKDLENCFKLLKLWRVWQRQVIYEKGAESYNNKMGPNGKIGDGWDYEVYTKTNFAIAKFSTWFPWRTKLIPWKAQAATVSWPRGEKKEIK